LFYKQSFEIGSLNSEVLNELFDEVVLYVQGLKIEIDSIKGNHLSNKRHPAATVGLNIQNPTIQFIDSLDKEERISIPFLPLLPIQNISYIFWKILSMIGKTLFFFHNPLIDPT